ncbi:polysaccharide pyruvyl transferase family protein [Dechloromonas sp. A34]|uniref:polysaccharide pyruvyl transferase family protein n=1 Tax=Dechloromonas sp. A34 TaxID=447588 RepID=UPI0022492C7D|nr:polysaccharide pyruvyl transferase family protein [Dechloromonas sp. A34]
MNRPIVFFGAFDRHNFGDILLGHVAAAECEAGEGTFAGLAARDLTAWGGQRIAALDSWPVPLNLIHVGGELLDCYAAQAAYMLDEPGLCWRRQAPYVVARHELPTGSVVEFRAVGGVGLDERDVGFRAEVLAALAEAGSVSVRERTTQALLRAAGIDAPLVPDPVTRIGERFGARIRARIRRRDPYLAVQFAAECADDATLAAFARGLERLGLPVVLFRAGAALWHDALEPYRRLAARSVLPMEIFVSLDVWDICALIAGSRGYVGTSLHGRLVAEAFAVPALSLEREAGAARKLRAYLATWSPGCVPLAPEVFADGGFIFPPSR